MPPQKEQKRIIEKLDRLMKYCDALEGKIKQSKTDSEKLMQAVLQETFEN
jgi:type I restriction enzyme S subunit